MNVLGIIAFGENPAACLLRDGKLVAFAEEERFTRLKGSDGMFPTKAAAYCLNFDTTQGKSIDRVAFGWDTGKYPWWMGRHFARSYFKFARRARSAFRERGDHSSILESIAAITEYLPSQITSKIHEGLRAAGLKGDFPSIEYVPHHLAHAYSSYFCSDLNDAGILTIDGSGEDVCTQLRIAQGDSVHTVETIQIPNSLGWFYAAITQYLGFLPYRDEGKLMGLAALGEARKDNNRWLEPLGRVLRISSDGYEVDPTFTRLGGHYYGNRFTDALAKLLTSVDSNAGPIAYGEKTSAAGKQQSKYLLDHYVDLAWAAQELLERAAIMLARKLVRQHGCKNLCVAGGVALNCKMNGEILRESGCDNIFVQPASSDGGTALGAAMVVAQKYGDPIRNSLKHVQYGPGFSSDEIQKALDQCGVPYLKTDRPSEAAAQFLEQGRIVAWFQGRMEFGARALGGRSILANPLLPSMKSLVNDRVKYRENWRPFCPSLVKESQSRYIETRNDARFMIVAHPMKQEVQSEVPAVVHVDGTVRPQVVEKEVNPRFHDLISDFGKRTGHSILLNTSLNVRGEPIVCTPLDAVRCFYSNGLDALVLQDFVLSKTQ